MAWLVILSLTLSLSASIALAEPSCGKAWFQFPSGTQMANGKLTVFENAADKKSAIIKELDNDGKVLKEIKIPRNIEHLMSYQITGDGYTYRAEGNKLFHFDPSANMEHEIASAATGTNYCSRSGVKTSVIKFCGTDAIKTVYDFKSHNKITIPNPEKAEVQGQSILYSEAPPTETAISKISVYDFATGKKQTFEVPGTSNMQFVSDKRISIYRTGENKPVNLVKVKGQWKKFEDKYGRSFSGMTSDGQLMFGNYKHKSGKEVAPSGDNLQEFKFWTDIYDSTGTKKKATVDGYYGNDYSGSSAIVRTEFPQKYSLFSEKDLKQIIAGKKPKPALQSTTDYPKLSPSGKWGVNQNTTTGKAELVNLESKKSFKLPFNPLYITEPDSGPNLVLNGDGNAAAMINTATGKIRQLQGSSYPQYDKNLENWYQYRSSLATVKPVCLPDTVKVIEDDCNCLLKNAESDNKPISNDSLGSIQDIALATMCQSNAFDNKAWDKITPDLTKGEISKKQAKLYLKRFQKREGFDPKKHTAILSAILKSDMVEKEPDLVMQAFKTISYANPQEIKTYYNVFKIDRRLPDEYSEDEANICRAGMENLTIESKLRTLKSLAATVDQRTTGDDWTEYKPFKSEIKKLPASEREAIVDGIAESMSQNAGNSAELKGVFQSKLYYFSKKYALGLAGEKSKSATDLAVAVRDGRNVPIIMGSGDIKGASAVAYEDVPDMNNVYGFSYKILDPIEMDKKAKVGTKVTKKVSWQHDGQNFSADTKTTVLEPLGNMIPKDKAPNYSALKKDGKLTGMMIVGNNLSSGHYNVVDEYVTYYSNQGFEFKEAKDIDAVTFFKDSVKSGELDYLIKEAHSDGDEKNLFRANTHGKLLEGSLTKPDGTKEVIYLLAPDAQKTGSKLISNQEFGSWIRDREKDQPLVYLNASCNSARKVISEIAATHSPNFLPIPSESSVRTFADNENSGERQILQSFRDGKNYEGIRDSLKQSENFKKGEDKFIFPDEEKYDKSIRDNLIMNLDIEIKVKDAKGNEVHIDQNVDH